MAAMVKRRQIDVSVRTAGSADAAFRLLADGTTWPSWAPVESFELERAGDPPPEGVGAIRVFKRGRTTGRDEIVEVVPGRRLGYVSLSGLPIRDYRAIVDIESARHGSALPAGHREVPRPMRRRARPPGGQENLSGQSS
jgi:hypothetical protein